MPLDTARVIDQLRRLDAETSNEAGAQRIAWTERWQAARAWFRNECRDLPLESEVDESGNAWHTLRGRSETCLVIGSHLDSVYGGGWLDGSLGVLGALAVVRRLWETYGADLPLSLRIVDWADEEGARFGRSLLGSSACSGTLELDEIRNSRDEDGILLRDAMRVHGVDLERVKDSRHQLDDVAAYLELHIEQGPVLERGGIPVAAVTGCCGAARYIVRFKGFPSHPAATPMDARQDALLAGSHFIVDSHTIGNRHGGITSIGYTKLSPGKMTILAGLCEIVIEQNHFDGAVLAQMEAEAVARARQIAEMCHCQVEFEDLWRIDTLRFDPDLVALAAGSVSELTGSDFTMPSGPLHDAGEMVRAGIPTAMLFVQSLRGLSHNKEEDTRVADIETALEALDRLAEKTMTKLSRELV